MKIINHYTLYLLFLTTFLLGVVGFWVLYPQKVMVIENPQSVKLDKTTYHKGDRVTYELKYCKYKPYTATVLQTLVNSIRISYTEMHSNLEMGCRTLRSSDLEIPEFAETGRYHIETTIEYVINPLRTERITWKSQEFEIVPSEQVTDMEDQLKENTKDIKKLQ